MHVQCKIYDDSSPPPVARSRIGNRLPVIPEIFRKRTHGSRMYIHVIIHTMQPAPSADTMTRMIQRLLCAGNRQAEASFLCRYQAQAACCDQLSHHCLTPEFGHIDCFARKGKRFFANNKSQLPNARQPIAGSTAVELRYEIRNLRT